MFTFIVTLEKIFSSKKDNPEKSVKSLLNFFLKRGITCIIPSFHILKKDLILIRQNLQLVFLEIMF